MPQDSVDPATRLLDVLRPLHADAHSNQPKTVGVVVARKYQLDYPDDTAEVLRKVALILALPAQFREAMEQLDLDVTPWLTYFPNVEDAMSKLALGNSTKSAMAKVDGATLNQLEMAHSLLTAHGHEEPTLTQEDEDQVRALLDDVEEALEGDDLSAAAREFLARHLRLMRIAMVDARIVGAEPLRDAAYTAVGDAFAHPEIRKELNEHKGGKRFFEAVKQVVLLLALTHGALRELPDDIKALTSGPEPTVVVIEHSDGQPHP